VKHKINITQVTIEVQADGHSRTVHMTPTGAELMEIEQDPHGFLSRATDALAEMLLIAEGELPLHNNPENGGKLEYNPAFVQKYGQKAAEDYGRELSK
jgi:hypothetical protein